MITSRETRKQEFCRKNLICLEAQWWRNNNLQRMTRSFPSFMMDPLHAQFTDNQVGPHGEVRHLPYGNGTLRITDRQGFQLHGILKETLRDTIRGINECKLSTIAACGDVNRNVMCTPLAEASAVHEAAYRVAGEISEHLAPRTSA